MTISLKVANLPPSATEAELVELFSKAGRVKRVSLTLNEGSERLRGLGFVVMSNGKEAARAVKMLNGHNLGGRALVVNLSRPHSVTVPSDLGMGL